MAKFPNSPGALTLACLTPATRTIPAGTSLARVYYSRSRHPFGWNEFRHFGPLNARWDHHVPGGAGEPVVQERGVYYAAANAKTCLAEFFQTTRRIDRVFRAPWLVVFATVQPLVVLDLTSDFTTRMGASMAIHSESRRRARGWARDLYEAFGDAQGILYSSSMNGGEPALALHDRAERAEPFPPHPLFHRALADHVLLDPLKQAAEELGYALR